MTDRHCAYDDLMAWSGLAFRTRRFEGDNGQLGSTSDGVGEGPDEFATIETATGRHIRDVVADRITAYTDKLNMETLAPEIVSTIDAGLPALTYPPHWNVALIYGYQEQGKRVLLRDYYKGDAEYLLETSDLVPFLLLIEDRGGPLAPADALADALRTAVRNWDREPVYTPYNMGHYHYGASGFRKWHEHVGRHTSATDAEEFSAFVHPFVLLCLRDARRAAVRFLRDQSALLPGEVGASLRRAADLYEEEVALLTSEPWDKKGPDAFHEFLEAAAELESGAIAQFTNILNSSSNAFKA